MKFLMKPLLVFTTLFCLNAPLSAKDSHYEKALQAYQQNKYDESYTYAKDALQEDPKNLLAKLLMGKLLTQKHNYAAAIKEFRQALDYKIDIHLVLVPLGNALLLNQQYQEVIDLGNGYDLNNEIKFEWKLLSAVAYTNLSKLPKARKQYRDALQIFSNDTRAINGLAFLDVYEGNIDRADEAAIQSFRINPLNNRTWLLKGKIAEARDNLTEAIDAYRKAINIDPKDTIAKRFLAYALLRQNRLEEAKIITEDIIKQSSDDPFALLLSSWILSKNNLSDLANSVISNLSSKFSLVTDETYKNHESISFVRGMTEYLQGKLEQARRTLARYVERNRADINASAILADIYLSLDQPNTALQTLEKIEEIIIEDLNVSLTLAKLYMQNGKDFKADFLLANIRERYPDELKVILMSAKALTARGKVDEAIALLESNENSNDNSELLLAKGFLHVQNEQFVSALNIAESLVTINNRNIDYWTLQSAALLGLEEYELAKTAIDNALALDPKHFPGRFNQATLLSKTNRLTEAKTQLNLLLEEQPRNSATQFQLALVESELKELDSAINRLNAVTTLEFNNVKAQSLLLDLYLENQQADAALIRVKRLNKEFPAVSEFDVKKAEILIHHKDFEGAKLQFNKLYNTWLDSPSNLYKLNKMQQSASDYEGAIKSLTRALSFIPNDLKLNLELAKLHLQIGDIAIAEEIVNRLLATDKNVPAIAFLQGDIALAKSEYVQAHRYFVKALDSKTNNQLVITRLFELAKMNVNQPEFLDLLTRLVQEQPNNNWLRKILADHLMDQNKWQQAKDHYLALLEQEKMKTSYTVLNNLATIYMDENIEKAYDYSQQAAEIGKAQPEVLDTHGWILTKMGRYEEGLVSLRQAHALNSNDPSIRYHIAFTLQKLGRLAESLREVEKILINYENFPEYEATKKLQTALQIVS